MSFAHDARTFAMSQMSQIKYDSMMAKPNVTRFFPFHTVRTKFCLHLRNIATQFFFPSTERGAELLGKLERNYQSADARLRRVNENR